MQNVEHKIEKNKLIITVDLSKRLGPSKSGKTNIIATTAGNVAVGTDGIKFGLNVYVPVTGDGKTK